MKRDEVANYVVQNEASCLVKGFEQLKSSKLDLANGLQKLLHFKLL